MRVTIETERTFRISNVMLQVKIFLWNDVVYEPNTKSIVHGHMEFRIFHRSNIM